MGIYRVHYTIGRSAPHGSVIAINFSARRFTNVVDENVQPINFERTGGTLTVSTVPEPSMLLVWMLLATLVITVRRLKTQQLQQIALAQ